MTNQCKGCQRGLPVYNGIHTGEQEMFLCEQDGFELELEPLDESEPREKWYQPEKKVNNNAWFRSGT